MTKQAVIFGAGNVGRGFIGQLCAESGYELVFVDIDQELLDAINARGYYTLRLVTNESQEEIQIGPARGIHADDQEAVARALAEADLAATAVGARALPILAKHLAAGIVQRAQTRVDAPLNVIICENLRDAASIFRQLVRKQLPQEYHDYLDSHTGFVMTIISRMLPVLPPEQRAQDPTLVVAEPYKHLPVDRSGFVGPIPNIVGMEPKDDFGAWVERKLYIHNGGHAVLAYLGYQRGHTYGYEALGDPVVRVKVEQAMWEAAQALAAEHGFALVELKAHIADILRRTENRILGDTILRLARDPLRKLGPRDRLVGGAQLALAHQIKPDAIVWGIAAGLAYDEPKDPWAQELQAQLRSTGLDGVLQSVCGLDPAGKLARLIRDRYSALCAGGLS